MMNYVEEIESFLTANKMKQNDGNHECLSTYTAD